MKDKMENIRSILTAKKELGLLYIDTTSIQAVEAIVGWEIFDKIIELIDNFILEHKNLFHHWHVNSFWKTLSDSFVLLIESTHGEIILENLEFLCVHLQNEIVERIRKNQRYLPVHPVLQVGYTVLRHSPNVRLERLVGRAIEEAHKVASTFSQRDQNFQMQKLKQIIEERKIYTVFQPIVNLQTGDCIGYEALARGPKGSPFEAPEVMFSIAMKAGIVFQLEDLCKSKLIMQFSHPYDRLMFVNLEPSLLESKTYKKLSLFATPVDYKSKIVIEITERMACKDYYSLDSNLRELRALGYKIAMDDVGSSYSSLESIVYIKPDFIKINYSLILGIHTDFIKQEIAKTLVDIARKINAKTVAEGIESIDDLLCLQAMNVDYGQGFYISFPANYPSKAKINVKPWKHSP